MNVRRFMVITVSSRQVKRWVVIDCDQHRSGSITDGMRAGQGLIKVTESVEDPKGEAMTDPGPTELAARQHSYIANKTKGDYVASSAGPSVSVILRPLGIEATAVPLLTPNPARSDQEDSCSAAN